MTENKRFWCLDEYKGETSPIVDGKFAPTNEWLCNELNELYEENQSIKKHIGELYKYVKIDVDDGIEVYPKVMLEYIINILNIIGDVE